MIRKILATAFCIALLSCGDDPAGPSGTLSVSVTAPPAGGAHATDTYTVEWTGEGNGTVALYYNTVQSPTGQELIASGLEVSGSHSWDLSLVPNGSYYVRAVITSGMDTASDYSDGTLTVDHSQDEHGIVITAPPAGGAQADDSYTIQWVSSGFSEGTVTLWFDTDTDPSEGLVSIADDVGCPDYLSSYTWNCGAVPEGSYYIYGVLSDPSIDGTYEVYSEGMLTISH